MSTTSIEGKIGLEVENINAATNALSHVMGGNGAGGGLLTQSILLGLENYATANPSVIKHGSLDTLADFIVRDFGGNTVITRRDPHPWLINIDVRCSDGEYAFINASLSAISVTFAEPSKDILFSEHKLDADDYLRRAQAAMHKMMKVSALRTSDTVVKHRVALISERVYDSMQSLIHLSRFIDDKILPDEFESITVRGFSLLDDSLVRRFLGVKSSSISASEFHSLKLAPDVDIIASMDWHWPSKSPADIDRLRDFVLPKLQRVEKTKTAFVALDLEKRIWVEQEETLFSAISILKNQFGFSKVVVNGMTSPLGLDPGAPFFEEVKEKEAGFITRLMQRVPGLETVHLHRTTIADKLSAVAECSYFISPAGSAALFPLILLIPGIAFGTREFLRASKNLVPSNDMSFALLDPDFVKTVKDDMSIMKYSWSTASPQGMSYSIEPTKILDLLQKHLSERLQ